MPLDAFLSRPGHLIRRLNQISVALFLEEIGHLDLTPRQYAALNMIEVVPSIDQASLSNLIAMDKTTLVKIIDRLVEKELITRDRSETDRRTNQLNITDAGRALLKQVLPLLERSDQRILAPLSRPDQRRFMEMLTQLVHINNIYSRAPMNSDMVDGLAARSASARKAGKALGKAS
ncbi:MAG TPA: MarR family transcriptional regulator [Burkholderiaceae bacterium]|nr:MarR family transcriptional regulator [Burkholderiaceae bacterium]